MKHTNLEKLALRWLLNVIINGVKPANIASPSNDGTCVDCGLTNIHSAD